MYRNNYKQISAKKQTNKNSAAKQTKKPEWNSSTVDEDKYKLSHSEIVQKKVALMSKHRLQAKEEWMERQRKLQEGILDDETLSVYETARDAKNLNNKKYDRPRKNLTQMIDFNRSNLHFSTDVSKDLGNSQFTEQNESSNNGKDDSDFLKNIQKKVEETRIFVDKLQSCACSDDPTHVIKADSFSKQKANQEKQNQKRNTSQNQTTRSSVSRIQNNSQIMNKNSSFNSNQSGITFKKAGNSVKKTDPKKELERKKQMLQQKLEEEQKLIKENEKIIKQEMINEQSKEMGTYLQSLAKIEDTIKFMEENIIKEEKDLAQNLENQFQREELSQASCKNQTENSYPDFSKKSKNLRQNSQDRKCSQGQKSGQKQISRYNSNKSIDFSLSNNSYQISDEKNKNEQDNSYDKNQQQDQYFKNEMIQNYKFSDQNKQKNQYAEDGQENNLNQFNDAKDYFEQLKMIEQKYQLNDQNQNNISDQKNKKVFHSNLSPVQQKQYCDEEVKSLIIRNRSLNKNNSQEKQVQKTQVYEQNSQNPNQISQNLEQKLNQCEKQQNQGETIKNEQYNQQQLQEISINYQESFQQNQKNQNNWDQKKEIINQDNVKDNKNKGKSDNQEYFDEEDLDIERIKSMLESTKKDLENMNGSFMEAPHMSFNRSLNDITNSNVQVKINQSFQAKKNPSDLVHIDCEKPFYHQKSFQGDISSISNNNNSFNIFNQMGNKENSNHQTHLNQNQNENQYQQNQEREQFLLKNQGLSGEKPNFTKKKQVQFQVEEKYQNQSQIYQQKLQQQQFQQLNKNSEYEDFDIENELPRTFNLMQQPKFSDTVKQFNQKSYGKNESMSIRNYM